MIEGHFVLKLFIILVHRGKMKLTWLINSSFGYSNSFSPSTREHRNVLPCSVHRTIAL